MTREAVHLYAACWNEVEMLGFFFRHYDPWVDRYVMYDDGSTDGTLDTLRGHPKVDLRTLDRIDPDSLWRSHTAMFNSAWKQSRDVADWVVLADIDEHLHLAGGADVRSYLAAQRGLGVTLIPALGFNMVSLDVPVGEGRLVDLVRRGEAARDFNKLAVFDPDAVDETTMAEGRHVAAPSGRLLLPARDELMLCHFKRLGLRHWQGRADELAERLGPGDRADGLGRHYLFPRDHRVERWPTILSESIEVNGPGFVADQAAERPLWWAGLERVSAVPVNAPVTPDFHVNWGGVVRRDWPAMFAEEGIVGAQGLHFLEIGCFEGQTTLWLLESVLTHPTSRISVIDTFEGSPEFVELGVSPDFRDRFLGNVSGYVDRVTVYEGRSQEVLPTLEGPFDFVFVDGSHVADDVWTDATLAWPLLKRGRLLAFDDYLWGDRGPSTPHPAIRRFLSEYAKELDLYHLDFHCIVRKL